MHKYALPLLATLAFTLFGIWLFYPKQIAPLPEKILICGVCKNVAPCLKSTIASIEAVGKRFSDYQVFIYENNSTDGTKEMLAKWASKNPHVHITSEDLTHEALLKACISHTKEQNPFRTELIARARNIVLNQALSSCYDDYPYLLMADLDFPKKWDIAGIMSCFEQKTPWDALIANGIHRKTRLFDRYAFRDAQKPLGPELLGDPWWKETSKRSIRIHQDRPLHPVYSAFGGLAIYKRAAIKECRYSGIVTCDLETLVQRIIQEKGSEHPQIAQYLNRNDEGLTIIPLSNAPDAIRWILNSNGLNAPVCCEHVTFHASMIARGHDRIFINPRMVMWYERRW